MKKCSKKSLITAIICEFNPMHTGHTYLIKKAKETTKCDYVVGLMSGNFTQRSEPAVFDKYTRAQIATQNGIDLVLNFPTAFCTNNAEVFALAGIKILNQIGADFLAFGTETDNENAFYSLANFMLNEPKIFKTKLKKNLQTGISYNKAYQKTLKENLQFFDQSLTNDILSILERPNNVLALEYIKAIKKTKSKIKPIFIKRVDNYNANNVVENFASASFLRTSLVQQKFDEIKKFLPQNSHKFFLNNDFVFPKVFKQKYEVFKQNLPASQAQKNAIFCAEKSTENIQFPTILKTLILYKIKSFSTPKIKKIYGINEGIENRLKTACENTNSFDKFYENLLTKRYKQNKINSILLNIILEIDKKTIKKIYTTKTNIFVKVLALNPEKRDILSNINSKFLILRKLDATNKRYNNLSKKIFDIENSANIVYNLIFDTHLFENDLFNKMKV
ncbi:MAG: nucleotidyltransferase family protein [Christensenellales bacterium]